MNDLQIAGELRAAASHLRSHGWIQGHAYVDTSDPTRGTCVGGALYAVRGGYPIYRHVAAMGFSNNDPHSDPEWAGMGIWNDTPGRTLDEVLDRLESTALALEVRALAVERLRDSTSNRTVTELAPERELATSSIEVNK